MNFYKNFPWPGQPFSRMLQAINSKQFQMWIFHSREPYHCSKQHVDTALLLCQRPQYSDRDGSHAHRVQIEIEPPIERTSFPDHLPQQCATGLCQHGINKKVLLFQGFRQRTARAGVLLVNRGIAYLFSNDIQVWCRLVLFRSGLVNLVAHGTDQYLPGGTGIAEIHPVNRSGLIDMDTVPERFQKPPERKPGTYIIGTGNDDVRRTVLSLPCFRHRITAGFRCPCCAEKRLIRVTSATALFRPISGSENNWRPMLDSDTASGS